MSAVVGIDLGTTNTVVATVRNGKAMTLATGKGAHLIPSVVAFPPSGEVLVGAPAKERRLMDAANTVYSSKRLIGRTFDSKEVASNMTRWPFHLSEGPGHSVLISVREQTYTVSEIAAFILTEVKNVAEKALGEPVGRAVITVPANFNDLQRAATKVSGSIAGFDVLRILNEPTAAALAYGYARNRTERIVVYDFGGGTFDVTVLELSGNVFEVLATAGDTFLGGDDVDRLIADRMAEMFLKKHRYDPTVDRQVFERVLSKAERLKVRLSRKAQASVSLDDVAYGERGRLLDMTFQMNRNELNVLCRSLVDRTMTVTKDALAVAGLSVDQIDRVVLVGGSSRLPLVKTQVRTFFGKAPEDRVAADEVVALGAAIQGAALTGQLRARKHVEQKAPKPGRTAPGLGTHRKSSPEHRPPAPSQADDAPTEIMNRKDLLGSVDTAPARPVPPPPHESVLPIVTAPAPRTAAKGGTQRMRSGTSPSAVPLPLVGSDGQRTPAPVLQSGQTTAKMPSAVPPRTPAPPVEIPNLEPPSIELEALRSPAPPMAPSPSARKVGPPKGPSSPPLPLIDSSPPNKAPQPPKHRPPAPVTAPAPSPVAPAPAAPRTVPMKAPSEPFPGAPLLVDVTPLSLVVETVGGYCDAIIDRNTPVPCEETRLFTTASDQQVSVRLRIAQGESRRFGENSRLGELVLTGLRAAPRGEVQIAVSFSLDASGMLDVRAADVATGVETTSRIELAGVASDASFEASKRKVEKMLAGR